jgi:hypothetical protein
MIKKLELDNRIAIYGSSREIELAETAITAQMPELPHLPEPMARLSLQQIIDRNDIKASIVFDGNTVWSFSRIIRDIRRVKKSGMEAMSDYLYKFLSLSCGSIAHFNKPGWIETYPTVEHLKQFFRRNEFGQRVKEHIPQRFAEVYVIVAQIEDILGI